MQPILAASDPHMVPALAWTFPFAILLLCIAILPLIKTTEHWWHHNRNKLIVASILGAITLMHYGTRDFGVHLHDPFVNKLMSWLKLPVTMHAEHAAANPGLPTLVGALGNAAMEYLPFISLLFSLYVVAGGIRVTGDIPAHPFTNTTFLGIGGILASFIGTTGASMLLIRPLLSTNSERKYVAHTVIFFIFIVSNVGGTLLPIGDPPLFLGYLRGVPFLWTLNLWREWLFVLVILLAIYYVWDARRYEKETIKDIVRDETVRRPLSIKGNINFLLLAAIVFATGTLSPGKPFLDTSFVPFTFMREIIQLTIVGLSLLVTPAGIRQNNNFNYGAILEVACLFIGIFVCMQVPIEILNAKGGSLGIDTPIEFFWITGALSSVLDNAPTYVVFFETANALTHIPSPETITLLSGHIIRMDHLVAISLGAVFMGANTYIGNGPNFMVKAIAEHEGVKMPGFFKYMLYSGCILIPIFILMSWVFF